MRRWTLVLVTLLLVLALAGCTAPEPAGPAATPVDPDKVSLRVTIEVLSEPDRRIEALAHFSDGIVPDEASWGWGDSTSRVDNPAVHVYRADGAYTVTVQAIHPEEGLMEAIYGLRLGDAADTAEPPQGTAVTPTPTKAPDDEGPVPETIGLEDAPFTVSVEGTVARINALEPFSLVEVDWGDGVQNNATQHEYRANGVFTVTVVFTFEERYAMTTAEAAVLTYRPHAIVGIPDTGINPYHEMFYRPDLTSHPCTYIEDFPCDTPALEFSVGPGHGSWDDRFAADEDIWDSIQEGTWYWIPQTVFVGVYCEPDYDRPAYRGDHCILDDAHMHGTGTVSSALMENPDALFAFKDGGPGHDEFITSGIPVDILSVSWGTIAPIPVLGQAIPNSPVYVVSAGNDPRSTLADGWAGDPRVISVGGAYAQDDTQEVNAALQPEVVSYFCRPVAQTMSIDEIRESYCGTSFAGPTVAGALSKVILELRRDSGYTGGIAGNHVDPLQGITKKDIRDAMNRTASYAPEAQYPNSCFYCLPLNPLAPWTQWGWGFYDGLVADETLRLLRGGEVPDKPVEAYTYMETVYLAKQLTHPLS